MAPMRSALLVGTTIGIVVSCAATGLAASDATYAALRAARPQGPAIAVRGLALERDAFRFRFESGAFQFLAPVEGRVVGAVFVGRGLWELTPASDIERRHLAFMSRMPDLRTLTDRFESLVLLFTDETAAEIRREGTAGGTLREAAGVFEEFLRSERKDLKANLHLRVLQDLENGRIGEGVFVALVKGATLPAALAAVDPGGFELLRVGGERLGSAECGLYVHDPQQGGLWYLSHRADEVAARVSDPPRSLVDAARYDVDTTILRTAELRGTTEMLISTLVPGVRMLPVNLDGRLRLQSAEYAVDAPAPAWREAAFVQEPAGEDDDAAVVLPAPAPGDRKIRVRLTYRGSDLLEDVGEGNFVVRARESWYPNVGVFGDPALFELRFRVPKGNDVVSVGRMVDDRVEADAHATIWRTDEPIRVAGFNYGRFKKRVRHDDDTGLDIQVFTNPGTPEIVKEINRVLEATSAPQTEVGSPVIADLDSPFPILPQSGPRTLTVDTSSLAESALVDAQNGARLASAYFGKLPPGPLSITQQSQWSFGQSWPSLIFLPYVAYLDSTARLQLGLQGVGSFVESVGYHEVAHQWWGHRVGWESYEDQWLSEGFAEFTAALALQYSGGPRRYARFWDNAQRRILDKRGDTSNDAVGPIVLGTRLATTRAPGAYEAMVYDKGAFVLHMLRMMMREPYAKNPDAAFMALMKDYVATYAGRSPSTRDFERIVERHMVPALNATGDGKIAWFFDQWVYGTEIPHYRDAVEAKRVAGDQYVLSGSVSQEGVSPSFLALMPIYAELDQGRTVRIGVLPLKGSTSVPVKLTLKLPSKPRRILINALHEVLAR